MQGASILQANIAKKLCYSCSVALALVLLSFCVLACSVASGCGASEVSSTCQLAYFDWHFEVQKQNGLFVITSMGLYPTGSQNQ